MRLVGQVWRLQIERLMILDPAMGRRWQTQCKVRVHKKRPGD